MNWKRKVCMWLWPCVKKFLAVCLALLGAWGVYVTASKPRVFVYPSVSLDPNDPKSTIFVVRNEGYLPIHDVNFECSINYFILSDGTLVIAQLPFENRFYDSKQVARVIAPGEEWSELLPFASRKYKFKDADISVNLLFRPWFFSSHVRKEKHRFVTRQGKDGHWHWLPQPINK